MQQYIYLEISIHNAAMNVSIHIMFRSVTWLQTAITVLAAAVQWLDFLNKIYLSQPKK